MRYLFVAFGYFLLVKDPFYNVPQNSTLLTELQPGDSEFDMVKNEVGIHFGVSRLSESNA